MKIELFLDEDVHSGWHMPCVKEDMMPFMLRNWIGKDGLIQISFNLPFSKNDVFLLSM
jgi:hypothetical protein